MDQETQQSQSVEQQGQDTASQTDASTTQQADSNQEGQVTEQAAPPAYTPNYKYKIHKKEYEFDEFVRGAIKDAETEKKIRELYEKARGLDEVVKPAFDETTNKYKSAESELSKFKTGLQELQDLYHNEDFEGLFQQMGISQEKILQWVWNKVQYNQLPEDQKRLRDGEAQAKQRAYLAERERRELENRYRSEISQARDYQLQSVLEKPGVKEAVEAFEAKMGPGSFRSEVIRLGQWTEQYKKIDLSPEEAVNQVLRLIGHQQDATPAGNSGQTASPAQGGMQAPVAQKKEPPVIPNVTGGSSSPAKKKITSIEELKKLANSM